MSGSRRKRHTGINMEQVEPPSIEKSGWLTKKGKWGITDSWKRRWFELKNQRLTYYVSEAGDPKGSILLKLVTEVAPCVRSECKKDLSFKVVTPARTYFMFSDTEQEMKDWLTVLEEHVSYHTMRRDLTDAVSATALKSKNPEQEFEDNRKKAQVEAEKVYQEYVLRAQNTDLTSIEKHKLIQKAGKDKFGRPVMVFPAKSMPSGLDPDLLLLYIIKFMEANIKGEYSLVYVHSNLVNTPKFSWIRKVLGIFKRQYKKNLKNLYLVHPTIWVKAVFKFLKPFISSKFWKKLVYVETIYELYEYVPQKQLKFLNEGLLDVGADTPYVAPVFGAALEDVINRPDQPTEVPNVVLDCIKYMEENGTDQEGIFRLSGSANTVNKYKADYNAGNPVNLTEEPDANVVASLMKLYFRELPEPLLTWELYDHFVEAMKYPSKADQLSQIRALVYSLPPPNFKVLEVLTRFLKSFSKHSKTTKMTQENIALVFSPNILRTNGNELANLLDAGAVNSCVLMLIDQSSTIFAPVGHTLATEDTPEERALSQAFDTALSARASKRMSRRSGGSDRGKSKSDAKEHSPKKGGSSRRRNPGGSRGSQGSRGSRKKKA